MRIRTVLTATVFAAALAVGLGATAGAQTTTSAPKAETKSAPSTTVAISTTSAGNPGITPISAAPEPTLAFNPSDLSPENDEIYKCLEEQSVKAVPDFVSCSKAPSPILPATNELVWGVLSFAILLVFFIWKGYPAMKKGMDGRSDRIRDDLARADEAKSEAEEVLAKYQAQVANSKGEATRIIEDARATAEATKAELHKRAEAEIAEMRQRAAADVEASKVQAIADLRGEVATLAIGAAEAIVHNSLDHATQVALVDNYINTVGSQN